MSARGSYARRKIGNRVEDNRDRPELSHEDIAEIARALARWEHAQAKLRRPAQPKREVRHWHRQPQPAVRESLGELLARADAPKPEPLDTTGFELWIMDGDRPGRLALE